MMKDCKACFICLDTIDMKLENFIKYIVILNNINSNCDGNSDGECTCKLSLHINCLKEWLRHHSKMNSNSNSNLQPECPICHKKLVIKDFYTNDYPLFYYRNCTHKIFEKWKNEINETNSSILEIPEEIIASNNMTVAINVSTPSPYKNCCVCVCFTVISYFTFIIIKSII